jgi:hypothetical protein
MVPFTLARAFLSVVVTFSPGLAVPEASTTSLVLPPDGGLKGAGPDAPSPSERSHGFGGEPAKPIYMLAILQFIPVIMENHMLHQPEIKYVITRVHRVSNPAD